MTIHKFREEFKKFGQNKVSSSNRFTIKENSRELVEEIDYWHDRHLDDGSFRIFGARVSVFFYPAQKTRLIIENVE